MRRLAALLAALLIVACARPDPPALPATPGAPLVTPSAPSAPPPALSAQAAVATPEAAPLLSAPAPPASFERLRYLLPADMAGYSIPNPEAARATPTGFGIGLIAPDQEPSPRVTMVLAGGEEAFSEWRLQRGADSGATAVTVRGVPGSVRDDRLAYHLLWAEDGNLYTLMSPVGTAEDVIAFAEGLVAYDAATWRAVAGL